MVGISLFFQYFGFFALIGSIILVILVRKELKKQLPTEEERKQLIALKMINADEKKKKVLRNATLKLRQEKVFADYCRKNGYHK